MALNDIVTKLKSVHDEIKLRAVDNLSDKVKYDLIDVNELVDQTDCCSILIGWFSDKLDVDQEHNSKSIIADLWKVLLILKSVIEKSVNGKNLLAHLNAQDVLTKWRQQYESFQTFVTKETLKEVLNLLNVDDSESQLTTSYGGVSFKSSVDDSHHGPGQFLDQRNMSLPPRLLACTKEKRNYSPVTRSYIKRVTFSNDCLEDDALSEVSILATTHSSPFEWHPLTKMDRETLHMLHSALVSYKPEIIRDACIEFRGDVLENFPAEIFIQRPEILFTLQDILAVNANQALKSLAAQCLSKLSQKLLQRWKHCKQIKSGRKDQILLMTGQCESANQDTFDDDDESFADQINTTQLKRLQLQPFEFCLMILSQSACGMQTVNSLRAANACVQMFEQGLQLAREIFEGQLCHNKDTEESVSEIENEMMKALFMHNTKDNRVIFLMLLKSAIEFLSVSGLPETSTLASFVQKCAFDATLFLSHKHLHDTIEAPRHFEDVEKILTAMKYAIKVLHESSVPKLTDLKNALPALKYHENYRKYIPLVLQVAKSVRSRDQANVSSQIIQRLLLFEDAQVSSEAHFQLHSLVQDILGIGQALDIDGSRKLELSFLILDRGEIFKRLAKTCLDSKSPLPVKKAAADIILYLVKSEHILTKSLWKILSSEIIVPNLILLEACIHIEELATLANWIRDKYSNPDWKPSLPGNLRLLLSCPNFHIREEAQCNLRTILSREPNSHTKLPRFSRILQTDLAQLNLNLEFDNAKSDHETHHVDLKDIIDTLHLSPDYDVLSRQGALERLSLALNHAEIQTRFVRLNGPEILLRVLEKSLEETVNWIETLIEPLMKSFCSLFTSFKLDNELEQKFSYAVARCLFAAHEKYAFDVTAKAAILHLYKNCIKFEESVFTLPEALVHNLNFPVTVHGGRDVNNQDITVSDEAWPLLKTYWNLAWFGGIHVLAQWSAPKADPNFSPRLFLDASELTLIKNSFSEAILDQLSVGQSKTHSDYQEALQLAQAHAYLLRKSSKEPWIATLPWRNQFSRFMRLKPSTRNDEKLFLSIVEFLTHLAPYKGFSEVIAEIMSEGKENLSQILSQDQPKNGMDLFIRGHESVGVFLLKADKLSWNVEEKIWEHDLNLWSLKVLLKFAKFDELDKLKISRLQRMAGQQKSTLFKDCGCILYSLIMLDEYLSVQLPPKEWTNLDWLWKALIHRDASIRIVAFQISSTLATIHHGAKLLIGEDPLEFWNKFVDIILDRLESYQAKQAAMETLTNLLKLSENREAQWFGPIVEEKISGLKLNGEASMSPFFTSLNFEESVAKFFRAFSMTKNNRQMTAGGEESVRQNSLTISSIMSHHEVFEEPPSAFFIASILDFFAQVIKMDTNHGGEKFSSLALLKSSTFPYALVMAYDANEVQEGTEKLMYSLSDFLTVVLLNYEWAIDKILNEDCSISPSMLISTFHRLDLKPDKLMAMLTLLFGKGTRNEHLSIMIQKYKIALLEMCLRSNGSREFSAALFKYLHEHEKDVSIDDWDHKLVRDLSKQMLKNEDISALIHMLLVSSICKEVLIDELEILVKTTETLEKGTTKKIMLLNSFAFKNLRGQKFLVENLTLHRKLANLASKLCAQLIIAAADTKRNLMINICDILSLLSTLISHCPEAKASLAVNVNTDRGKSTSLLQFLVDIINHSNLGDELIRSKIWIPNAFRIITASLTSVECRSWVIRSQKFLNGKCVRDLDQSTCDQTLEVLWLDLLLSLTSYPDGQNWLAKNSELVDLLVERAAHQESLPSLAILRNLSFHPGGRAKLLLLSNYLSLLKDSLRNGAISRPQLRLALVSIWSLSANCHKAKVALARVGIPEHLENVEHELACKVLSVVTLHQ